MQIYSKLNFILGERNEITVSAMCPGLGSVSAKVASYSNCRCLACEGMLIHFMVENRHENDNGCMWIYSK